MLLRWHHAFIDVILVRMACRLFTGGFVANFAQGGMKGQLTLAVGGLSGQGVELFGRAEARLHPPFKLPFA